MCYHFFLLMAKKHFLQFTFWQITKCVISPKNISNCNKWGVKWKLMIPASYHNNRMQFFYSFWCDSLREAVNDHDVGRGGGFASYIAQTYLKWKLSMRRLRIYKAFRCAPKIFWLMAKKHFLQFTFQQITNCLISPKFLIDFNKWGLKWKLMMPVSYSKNVKKFKNQKFGQK